MVLLPTEHGWQASVRGKYKGSFFTFVFLVGDHLTANVGVLALVCATDRSI